MSVQANTPTRSEAAASDAALCRGVLYGALALGFRPPTEETVRRLIEADAVIALGDAARALEEAAGAEGLAGRAAALAMPEVSLETLLASHRRLFGHTARGEVPAYETEYGSEALFQQPQELGDLAGFAAAFGLGLAGDARERIDHVSCECEFLSFLSYKEAYAIDVGDAGMLAATRQAERLFLRDHLGRFVPAFRRRLERADRGGFYAALGDLLGALVERDCARFGVPSGAEALGLRPDPVAVAAPMGCAAGEAGCGSGGCG